MDQPENFKNHTGCIKFSHHAAMEVVPQLYECMPVTRQFRTELCTCVHQIICARFLIVTFSKADTNWKGQSDFMSKVSSLWDAFL